MHLDNIAIYVKIEDLMVDPEMPEQILLTTTVYDVPTYGRLTIDATKASFCDEADEPMSTVKAAEIMRTKSPDGFWIMASGNLEGHGRYYGPLPGSTNWAVDSTAAER